MAASFNRTSWWMKGDVVSTDLRVSNNYGDTNALNQVGGWQRVQANIDAACMCARVRVSVCVCPCACARACEHL